MSKAPLLLRSAPAQGTGSYAGLPGDLDSTPGSSDVDDTKNLDVRRWRNGVRKGKSALRQSHLRRDESRLGTEHDDSTGNPSGGSSGKYTTGRRWSAHRIRSGSDEDVTGVFDGAAEGQQESGLEARFTSNVNTGGAIISHTISDDSSMSSSIEDSSDDLEDDGLTDHRKRRDKVVEEDPPDNSPYPQVRASVAPTDDTTLSINTPRMWTFSILFAVLGSSTNLFFSLRYPSVSITPVIALLLVHPLGRIWDRLLKRSGDPVELFQNGHRLARDGSRRDSSGAHQSSPSDQPLRLSPRLSTIPSRTQRLRLWLAQGQWNAKEHCCVFIASNVSFGFAFATDVGTSVSKLFVLCIRPDQSYRS